MPPKPAAPAATPATPATPAAPAATPATAKAPAPPKTGGKNIDPAAPKGPIPPPADPKAAPTDGKTPPADAKAPPADGKTPPATADAGAASPDKEVAKKLEEGTKAQKAGQHEKAREALLAAWSLRQVPDVAFALAKSEMQLGKTRDAAEHLAFYLREGQTAKPEDRAAAEKLFAEAKAKVASVLVNVDVEGADVLVDGTSVGKSPLKGAIFVEPGARTIEARKEGAPEAKKPLEAQAGTETAVDLSLTPPPPPPIAPKPPPPPPPPAGPNKVIVLAGAGVAGGLALVGAGLAIGSAVVGSGSYDTWEENKCTRSSAQCLADFDASQGTKQTLGNTAIGLFIGAAVVGAGTGLYYYLGKRKASAPPPAALVVQPGGLQLKGSF